jgi:A/G-specific adenine glycosylase
MATDCSTSLFTSQWKQSFRRRLLAWFGKHKRDLPWRKSQDPYRIWVSEVMLQQTTVKMAEPHFVRFLKTFPTVKHLAAADESQVLRMWEGLGYYRRARAMHAAAKQIVALHDAKLPRDVTTLQTLPGVGRYTAGAIASMAYDLRAPILETNTVRVLARLLAYPDDTTKSAGQKILWAAAEEVLPQSNIAHFNQAMMELGSLVCTPSNPKCHACPVMMLCGAFAAGVQNEIPKLAAKQTITAVREASIVVRKNGQILVRRRGADERWAGMWDFPRFEILGEGPLFVRDEIITKLRTQTGITAKPGNLITTLKHGVTRYRITLDCYAAEYASGRAGAEKATRWVRPTELSELPLSVTARKLANLLTAKN